MEFYYTRSILETRLRINPSWSFQDRAWEAVGLCQGAEGRSSGSDVPGASYRFVDRRSSVRKLTNDRQARGAHFGQSNPRSRARACIEVGTRSKSWHIRVCAHGIDGFLRVPTKYYLRDSSCCSVLGVAFVRS
jgi:hypothetical protein